MSLFKRKEKNKYEGTFVDSRLSHIAFIMDGNGRWAKRRGMPREYGHSVGAKVFKRVSEYCGDIGIKHVTVYAFSTENWKRPKKEVNAIMKLLEQYLFEALDTLAEKNVQIHFIGDRSILSEKLISLMDKVEKESAYNEKILNIAINYGGKDDIVHAVNNALKGGKTSISEKDIDNNLYTAHSPSPDLIVRTGGDYRISNFLIWQSAYSEFIFTPKLWPELNEADIDNFVREFYTRQRRYGGL